jgi:hypothetical protein
VNLTLINTIAFQLGWFACVLGAARGNSWFGPAIVALSLVFHLVLARNTLTEMRLFVCAGVLGFLLDSAQAAAGTFSFTTTGAVAGGSPPWLSPPWMVALWPNFATTLHTSLGWLTGRYGLAALLGAVGGPLSYYAGARLGVLSFPKALFPSLCVVGIVWAIAMPALLRLADKR